MMQGIIIGGGISGLTAAAAMQQSGLVVKVYEKAPSFRASGPAMILAVNAMRVLDKLGLSAVVRAKGNELTGLNITDEALLPLSKNHVPYFLQKYGYAPVAIHRSDLRDILLETLEQDVLEMDKCCLRVVEKDRRVTAEFKDGMAAQGDYLFGADGIHSVIRKKLFPGIVSRDARQICWQGMLEFDLPVKYQHHAIEAWGRGRRFGFTGIAPDRVSWYGVMNKHDDRFDFQQPLKEELNRYFSEFSPLVRQLISGTREEQILRNDLADLRPADHWYHNRVCLLGDAVHAMMPNLGQGGCQAMEDAWTLAALMKKYKNPGYAFPEFQKTRKPRADYAGKLSYHIGQMTQYENSLLVGFRNRMIRSVPRVFTKKQYDRLFAPGE